MDVESIKDMDKECIKLFNAMNLMPGIQTTTSCCGHGKDTFNIWFIADNLEVLPPLLYCFDGCHCGVYGWNVIVKTDCAMSPVTFLLQSTLKGLRAYIAADTIAETIEKERALTKAPAASGANSQSTIENHK